jgi:hypothetical protein
LMWTTGRFCCVGDTLSVAVSLMSPMCTAAMVSAIAARSRQRARLLPSVRSVKARSETTTDVISRPRRRTGPRKPVRRAAASRTAQQFHFDSSCVSTTSDDKLGSSDDLEGGRDALLDQCQRHVDDTTALLKQTFLEIATDNAGSGVSLAAAVQCRIAPQNTRWKRPLSAVAGVSPHAGTE